MTLTPLQMMKQIGSGAGPSGLGESSGAAADLSDDSDDDGPPPLEEADPKA